MGVIFLAFLLACVCFGVWLVTIDCLYFFVWYMLTNFDVDFGSIRISNAVFVGILFQGSDSMVDDCVYHFVCPCCTLCQVIQNSLLSWLVVHTVLCEIKLLMTEHLSNFVVTITRVRTYLSMPTLSYWILYLCIMMQESRTLEINNVQDGTWHGRGDTICIGGIRNGSKALPEMIPPPIESIKLTDENYTL